MLLEIMSVALAFCGDFSPQEGVVAKPETEFRHELCLNGEWRFQPVPVPHGYEFDRGVLPELPPPASDKWENVPIKIPSPWNVNHWGNGPKVGPGTDRPYTPDSVYYPSYPENWIHYHQAWMERTFMIPGSWPRNHRVVLHFESVAGMCRVLVNGKPAGSHFDKYLPFDLDITGLVNRDGENLLQVGVQSYRLLDRRNADYKHMIAAYPTGSNTDRLNGIWQDVSLLALPPVRVDGVFVKPWVDRDTLEVEVSVRNDTAEPQQVKCAIRAYDWVNLAGNGMLEAPVPNWRLGDERLAFSGETVSVPGATCVTNTYRVQVYGRLKQWTPDAPNLSALLIRLDSGSGAAIDRKYQRFGWRQFTIRGRDLLLNGRKIQLKGDILHPFGAYAFSRRFVWAWYTMIKDMYGNAVRPHAQIYPRCYLDLADEMGICVLDETAIFGSSIRLDFTNPDFWRRYQNHFDGLVLRDRNHPSVMGWSFGNEMFAIFRLNKVGKEEEARWREQLVNVGLTGHKLDPTRPWLSCDGDDDLDGKLPVWNRHYGHGLAALERDAKGVDKPLMVGENGGTYYAPPHYLAQFAGERAFLDYAGRNDALGADVYQNIVKVALPHLAYFSASETAWFGLAMLPFGYSDFDRLPGRQDGILFRGVPQEGKFGMQIERLPPYVATLNPGFDPALPLYRPLGMFEAQKAAQCPSGPQPCPWDHLSPWRDRPKPPPPSVDRVQAFGSQKFLDQLAVFGVDAGTEASAMVLIAAAAIPDGAADAVERVLASGGSVVFFANRPPKDLARLNALLPASVRFTDRTATSLERGPKEHDWSNPISLDDCYFPEEEPREQRRVISCGVEGPFVDGGTVLLTASRTDWELFNRNPEESKVGAVACYENLRKPGGTAWAVYPCGKGRVSLCTVDYELATPRAARLFRLLFRSIGVRVSDKPVKREQKAGREHDLLLDGPIK